MRAARTYTLYVGSAHELEAVWYEAPLAVMVSARGRAMSTGPGHSGASL